MVGVFHCCMIIIFKQDKALSFTLLAEFDGKQHHMDNETVALHICDPICNNMLSERRLLKGIASRWSEGTVDRDSVKIGRGMILMTCY